MIFDRHETDANADERDRRACHSACLWCMTFGSSLCMLSIGFGASVVDRSDLASAVQILGGSGLLLFFAPLGVMLSGGLIDD